MQRETLRVKVKAHKHLQQNQVKGYLANPRLQVGGVKPPTTALFYRYTISSCAEVVEGRENGF